MSQADRRKLEKLVGEGVFPSAERLAHRLLQQHPRDPFATKALAVCLMRTDRQLEAMSLLRGALLAAPHDPELHANLGICLFEGGAIGDAWSCFEEASRLAPNVPLHYINAANACLRLGDDARAIEMAERALHLDSRNPEANRIKGVCLAARSDFEQALTFLVAAVELSDNDNVPALHALADTLMKMGRYGVATGIYEQLLEHYPGDQQALAKLVICQLHVCAWESLEQRVRVIRGQLMDGKDAWLPPFSALAVPGLSAADHKAIARLHSERLVDPGKAACFAAVPRNQSERLRIGYLSADLREHAVAHLLVGVLERHDRSRFEVFAYSAGKEDGSMYERRVRAAFDVFRDIRGLSDEAAARAMVDDGVDILVDLQGWTLGSRLGILAYRPAPVQISWLGYPGTVGHEALSDYVVGDPVVTPLRFADHYSQFLAWMPNCLQPNDAERVVADPPTRGEVGLPVEGFVFCCFNQSYKYNPACFELWCEILRQVPDSVLWLPQPDEDVTASNLRRELGIRGLTPERIVFARRTRTLAEHLGRTRLAGLMLDTFPYNSHTTGSDALWAGVPVVTLTGETYASRVATSLLRAVGLDDFVAADADSYIRIAVDFARDPKRQSAVGELLERARRSSSLFDTEGFTRDLESLYEAIWAQHLRGEKRHIAVPRR